MGLYIPQAQIQYIAWQSAWIGHRIERESKVWDDSQMSGSGDRETMAGWAWREKAVLGTDESENPVGYVIRETASTEGYACLWF